MLITEHSVTLLGIMEIAGPILLGLALLYGIMVASRRRRQKAAGDAATRSLFRRKDDEIG
jgi:hypothetical protein